MKIRSRKFTTWTYIAHWATLPFIVGMVVPLVILDLCAEVYHRFTFPVYGIPFVERSKYIRMDRQRLSYLSWYRKIFCMYCGYANGLLHYVSTIAGESEKYWCGIQHEAVEGFEAPKHHAQFAPYNDAEAFLRMYPEPEKTEQVAEAPQTVSSSSA